MKIILDNTYGYVLLTALSNALLYTLQGFHSGSSARKAHFGQDFMNKNFLKEHQEAFGKDEAPDRNGYPDNGNGRYA